MKKYKLVTLWKLDLPAETEWLCSETIAESYLEGVQQIKEDEDINLASSNPLLRWKVVSITITSLNQLFKMEDERMDNYAIGDVETKHFATVYSVHYYPRKNVHK